MIFNKLKRVLLESGYRVILTSNVSQSKAKGFARGVKGYIVPDDLKIFINKDIGVNDRVVTLVHELLHEIYPTWAEVKVNRSAKKIFQTLTVPQLGFLQFFIMMPTEIRSMLRSNNLSSVC
ncbi:MAG: hypothetical protein V1807_00500 [Patescibacteria group bacterium]